MQPLKGLCSRLDLEVCSLSIRDVHRQALLRHSTFSGGPAWQMPRTWPRLSTLQPCWVSAMEHSGDSVHSKTLRHMFAFLTVPELGLDAINSHLVHSQSGLCQAKSRTSSVHRQNFHWTPCCFGTKVLKCSDDRQFTCGSPEQGLSKVLYISIIPVSHGHALCNVLLLLLARCQPVRILPLHPKGLCQSCIQALPMHAFPSDTLSPLLTVIRRRA